MKVKIIFLVAALSITALLSTACKEAGGGCGEDCGWMDDTGQCECA